MHNGEKLSFKIMFPKLGNNMADDNINMCKNDPYQTKMLTSHIIYTNKKSMKLYPQYNGYIKQYANAVEQGSFDAKNHQEEESELMQ